MIYITYMENLKTLKVELIEIQKSGCQELRDGRNKKRLLKKQNFLFHTIWIKSENLMYNIMTIVDKTVLYNWSWLREYNLNVLMLKKVSGCCNRCDDYLTGRTISQCICQIIIFYFFNFFYFFTLNILQSCQFYVSNAGGKKKQKPISWSYKK